MNSREYVDALLEKFRNNTCTEAEQQVLMQWIEEQAAAGEPYHFANAQEKKQIQSRIAAGITPVVAAKKAKLRVAWMRYATAAAAAVLLAVCAYWLLQPAQQVWLASRPAQVLKAVLPDGSVVWLNDNAAIRYPADFAHNRTIELVRGEVFADVKKEETYPFIIKTGSVTTTVLGTSFSVKRIGGDAAVKISVASGKVSVSDAANTLAVLTPGQRLKYHTASRHAETDSVLQNEAGGWVNHSLLMEGASLQEVAQWLHDHYNITVRNQISADAGTYYLQLDTRAALTDVLAILNKIAMKHHVHFTQDAQTVLIQ